MSEVPEHIHRIWHQLTKNLCASKLKELLNNLLVGTLWCVILVHKPNPLHSYGCPGAGDPGECCTDWFHCTTEVTERERELWVTLRTTISQHTSQKTSIRETIRYINRRLIDADYYLKLVRK